MVSVRGNSEFPNSLPEVVGTPGKLIVVSGAFLGRSRGKEDSEDLGHLRWPKLGRSPLLHIIWVPLSRFSKKVSTGVQEGGPKAGFRIPGIFTICETCPRRFDLTEGPIDPESDASRLKVPRPKSGPLFFRNVERSLRDPGRGSQSRPSNRRVFSNYLVQMPYLNSLHRLFDVRWSRGSTLVGVGFR